MRILQRLLVALDGSATANYALELALQLHRQFGSELILCTALDEMGSIADTSTPKTVGRSAQFATTAYAPTANSLLKQASSRTRLAAVPCSTALLEGRPAGAIVAYANERKVDAIVMGTEGREDLNHLFHGSTAEGVLRLTDVPTFVVNRLESAVYDAIEDSPPIPINRILVALDDSDPSDAAIAFALDIAVAKDSVILCCSVIDTGQLVDNVRIYGDDPAPFVAEVRQAAFALIDAKTRGAARAGQRVECIVLEGDATEVILRLADERRADLVVCGTHGRRGLRRFSMGSVAESLVRRSAAPVLVVRKSDSS